MLERQRKPHILHLKQTTGSAHCLSDGSNVSSGFATWVLLGLLISNDSMEDERSEEVGRRSPEVVTGLVVIKA